MQKLNDLSRSLTVLTWIMHHSGTFLAADKLA